MPEISVIIPCYNHGHYLPHALNSVLAQTFADWEAIIVDDASTDNTREVAAQFTDRRVRYIHQENRGLSGARNTGIRSAGGEYLCFLDADDEWYPAFLETCISALSASHDTNIVGVYTSNVFIDEVGRVLPQRGNGVVPADELPDRLVAFNFFAVHSVLVRADIVREIGMFDEQLSAAEDKDLWYRITRRHTLLGIPEALVKYRVYPGSMSKNSARMHVNRMAVLSKHFGPDAGDPAQWLPKKRLAYGHGYLGSAFGHMSEGTADVGWKLFVRASQIYPDLLTSQRTYYIMACLDQPLGYRGEASDLDIPSIAAKVLSALELNIAGQREPLGSLYQRAVSSACLAFAALADQTGDWGLARRYTWQAFRNDPKQLLSESAVRRTMRLFGGKRLTSALRSLRIV